MNAPITKHHLTQYLSDFAARAESYRQAVAEIRGEGTAGGGLVLAAADFSGTVTELRLDARAMRLDSITLTEYLLEAIGTAQKAAKSRAAEASRELTEDAQAFARQSGAGTDLDAMAGSLGTDTQTIVRDALDRLRRL